MVCALDSLTHDVFDRDLATVDTGRYRALCGATVAAAPMSVPEGQRCATCAAVRSQHETSPSRRPRAVRRFA